MWFEKTIYWSGVLFLLGGCSSADPPSPSKGSTGGKNDQGANTSSGGVGSGGPPAGGSAVTDGGNGSGKGGSGQTADSGGSGTESSGGAATGTTGGSSTNASGGSSTGGSGGACVAEQYGMTPVPPILQFVIDKSTSMNDETASTGAGTSKWEATRAALGRAFGAMPSNFAVGESFFPNANGGCVNTGGGVTPAPLDATQLTALQRAIDAIPNPTDIVGTPTHDAWLEGLRRLQQTLNAPPPGYQNGTGYIVLVTDGMPVYARNCTASTGDNSAVSEVQFNELIANVAEVYASSQIQTFVIAVPGSEDTSLVPNAPNGSGLDYVPRSKLSELARAGGTATAGCSDTGSPSYCDFDMIDKPDFVTALLSALASITTQIISCSYTVPAPPSGSMIDPRVIDVTYTTGTGEVRPLAQATSAACSDGQWYVAASDAIGIPTQIQLCPSSCDTVSADSGARVSVAFQCIVQM